MQYLLSALFSALLVLAQSCWKVAVDGSHSPFKTGLNLGALIKFIFTPLVLSGAVIYVVAIFLYMYLLSKYHFSLVQSTVIPISLIFSILVALTFFGESLSIINYVGLVVIVIGIMLVTLR